MPEEIEEILDIKKDDIETLSLEETLKLKNIYRYPRIIGGILQGSEAIIGTGNYILRFKGDTGLWLGNATFGSAPFRVNMAGDVVANSILINGRSGQTIADAINASGNLITDIINARLDTSAKQILDAFTFGTSGAIQMITDANNGLWLSPNGILGKKAGATTFAINTSGDATFAGTLSAAIGTLGKITSAELITGNFQRDDFHWFTLFESIDGFDTSGTNTATTTISTFYVSLQTGTTSSSKANLIKCPFYLYSTYFTWDKNREFKTKIEKSATTNQNLWITMGKIDTNRHIGFKVINDILYATMANGTNEEIINLGTSSNPVDLRVVWVAGSGATFYVNETNRGTLSTYLPSGITDAGETLHIEILNTAAENKEIRVSMWDFWQAS